MSKKITKTKSKKLGLIERYAAKDDAEALKKLGELEKVWNQICYDDKSRWKTDFRKLYKILRFFDDDFREHIDLEEKVIFPYVKSHLPRLEYTIVALHADHDDFRRDIEFLYQKLRGIEEIHNESERKMIIHRLHGTIFYLIHLLRHHVQVESRGVFQVLSRELTDKEKKELGKKLFSKDSTRIKKR